MLGRRVSDQENVSVISCHNTIRCYNPKIVGSNPVTGISEEKKWQKSFKRSGLSKCDIGLEQNISVFDETVRYKTKIISKFGALKIIHF
jgi:hypothetical protein